MGSAVSRRTDEQKLHLEDIGADSIFQIFEYLNLIDLSMISETNKLLHDLARDYYRLKYSKNVTEIGSNLKTVEFRKASKIFRNFGNLIPAMKLVFSVDWKLVELHLPELKINMSKIKSFHPLLDYLEVLEIELIEDSNHTNKINSVPALVFIPQTFKLLKKLKFDRMDEQLFRKLTASNFPLLEVYTAIGGLVNESDWCRFIQRHPNIKTLILWFCDNITPKLVKFIGETMTQLTCFVMSGLRCNDNEVEFQDAMRPFGSMKSLRKLAVDCTRTGDGCAIEPLLNNLVANSIGIEHLQLDYTTLNENCETLLKSMKTIRTLVFGWIYHTKADLFSIAESLPLLNEFGIFAGNEVSFVSIKNLLANATELKKLTFRYVDFVINVETYAEMVKIVKQRQNSIPLELKLCSESINVPIDIIKENKKWINVVELT